MNKLDKWREKMQQTTITRPKIKGEKIKAWAIEWGDFIVLIEKKYTANKNRIGLTRSDAHTLRDWLVENLGGYQKIQTKEERQRLKPARCLALLDEDMDIIQTYDFTNLHTMIALGDKIRRDIADNNADVDFNIKSDRARELDEKHDGPEL